MTTGPSVELIALQRELEKLYNKNQTVTRIKSEFTNFKDFDFHRLFDEIGVPVDFAYHLLAQMALHKRCDLPTLVGVMRSYADDAQQAVDFIRKAAIADLLDWNPQLQLFIVNFTVSKEVQEELDRYQYPLPFVVQPKKVKTNRDTGMFMSGGSIILKNNHHDDDVCLDHINRCNKIKFRIERRVATLIKNQWRNLDKPKEGETREDFMRRKRAFEKYDRTAHDVMAKVTSINEDFHLGHKYCKRGRTYCQGYHVNYQGTAWNKAVINFANEELVV